MDLDNDRILAEVRALGSSDPEVLAPLLLALVRSIGAQFDAQPNKWRLSDLEYRWGGACASAVRGIEEAGAVNPPAPAAAVPRSRSTRRSAPPNQHPQR